MKSATFRGVKFSIDLCGPVDGFTDSPKAGKKPMLMICTPLDKRSGLEHACSFLKSEEAVTETARDLARFLWRLNYRHVED